MGHPNNPMMLYIAVSLVVARLIDEGLDWNRANQRTKHTCIICAPTPAHMANVMPMVICHLYNDFRPLSLSPLLPQLQDLEKGKKIGEKPRTMWLQ
jgi:hypothetical protein